MLARIAAVVGTATVIATVVAAPAVADPPAVTTLSPASGIAGTAVVITGSGLSAVTAVAFPGAADVATTPVSDSEIDTDVPASATSGPIVLRTAGGDVTAPMFTVLPLAGLSTSAHSVVYPSTSVLTADVRTAGVGIPGVPAHLEFRRTAVTTWSSGPTVSTDSTGKARFTVKPLATTAYRVDFAGTPSYGAITSRTETIVQHPRVVATLPSIAPILTRTTLTGGVGPAQTGSVAIQRSYSGAWHTVAHAQLTSKGHFSAALTFPSRGTYLYRVARPADANQAGNVSRSLTVVAVNRSLRSGDSGTDVTALQNRLKVLHYDVGTVNGRFGFDTAHAVVAFEKVQGLPRDGVVGNAVWKALASPRVPRLAHPLAGVEAIEVDLTKQVLYYAVNGHIVRILDSSTGGGYYYTGSDGTTQRAITPTGHFSIKYKIDRWVTAKLGVLYRPAYFNYSGYAIHGEPSVPPYPASHGCVRITVPAMDRLYAKLTDGMSVWIYRS